MIVPNTIKKYETFLATAYDDLSIAWIKNLKNKKQQPEFKNYIYDMANFFRDFLPELHFITLIETPFAIVFAYDNSILYLCCI